MTDDSLDPTGLTDEAEARAPHELTDVDGTLDEAERDVRIDATEGDDLPASPPDLMPRASEREMAGYEGEETIEQRIMQEEPDPTSAYGAPDDESGLGGGDLTSSDLAGGDDPDAIPESQNFVGGGPGLTEDADLTAVVDEAAVPAEESAMRVEDQGL